jgi:probable H4MPT-linked C1 transfer pathway protein
MPIALGWDIGGLTITVAAARDGLIQAARLRPYGLTRDPGALVPLLRDLAGEIESSIAPGTSGWSPAHVTHAVTMTAQLSPIFRTKREAVAVVLAALESAFPHSTIRVYAVDGRFLTPREARLAYREVAAASWATVARLVAQRHPNTILVGVGATTTDVVPIAGGAIAADGQTDPERLASGELVYTGAVHTPAEAIAQLVPLGQAMAGVSAERVAIAGDVHLWRGDLTSDDYASPTPDGRPATKEFAGERLARVVCADRETLDDDAVSRIAEWLAGAQVESLAKAIQRVREKHPDLQTVLVAGIGAFLGARAARGLGLDVLALETEAGEGGVRCGPVGALALLATRDGGSPARLTGRVDRGPTRETRTDVVVKIGGGLLAHPDSVASVLAVIGNSSRHYRVLIVPGGGPFAETVRQINRSLPVSDEASHWMAVLAMDQHAHLLAARLTRGVIVVDRAEISAAQLSGRLPVLAPSCWLRAEDPLPHSWDVTSDSIAAWVAGSLGASRLVLVKPPGTSGAPLDSLVDPYFSRAIPAGVTPVVVDAGRVDELRSALQE